MPKQLVDKDEILTAALSMIREQGCENVNARSVAKHMGYSVQPIYSYFANMQALKNELYEKSLEFYGEYIYTRVDKSSILLSMAKANIDFAKEETYLFRLLFLTKLRGINSFSDIFERMADRQVSKKISEELKISEEQTRQLYIMLIIFTHGISTMLATSGANISDNEIVSIVGKAYKAFCWLQSQDDKE